MPDQLSLTDALVGSVAIARRETEMRKQAETVIDRSETQAPEEAPLARRADATLAPLNGRPTGEATTILTIMDRAIQSGVAPEGLEKLFALYERDSAQKARQAFMGALAEFKADCPPIPRRTENTQFSVTRNGVKSNRRYAALEDIEATIRAPLGRHGLSFRWGEMRVDDGRLTMTCIVSHTGGHSESAPCTIPVDSKAGCSEQQKYGAAMTYAQRYSLIAALGLTSCDEDADGAANPQRITESQAANLQCLIDEVKADKPKFCKWMGVGGLDEITVADFPRAVRALEDKRSKS